MDTKIFSIAKFECNDSRKLRFITDIEDALEVNFHYDYKKKIDLVCQKHLGYEECEYCCLGLGSKIRYGFYVYDIDKNQIEVVISMVSEYSLLPRIVEAADQQQSQSLKHKDYVVDRDGVGINTNFYMIPVNRYKIKDFDTSLCTNEEMLKSIDSYFNNLYFENKAKKKIKA